MKGLDNGIALNSESREKIKKKYSYQSNNKRTAVEYSTLNEKKTKRGN